MSDREWEAGEPCMVALRDRGWTPGVFMAWIDPAKPAPGLPEVALAEARRRGIERLALVALNGDDRVLIEPRGIRPPTAREIMSTLLKFLAAEPADEQPELTRSQQERLRLSRATLRLAARDGKLVH